jgi:hypothetical protein
MDFSDPKFLAILALALVGGTALLLSLLKSPKATIVVVGIMIFAGATAAQDAGSNIVNATWLRPIQLRRAEIYLVGGVLVSIAMLIHLGRMGTKFPPFAAVTLWLINVYAGTLDTHHYDPKEGVLRIIFATVTLIPTMFMVSALIRDTNDILRWFRMVGIVGAVWTGACCIQFVLDRSQLVFPGTARFTGLLGNPQSAAVYVSPMTALMTWLVLNETSRKLRLFWIAVAGISIILLGWTGSRTGALTYMMGLTAVLYARAGRAVLFLPFVALGVYGLFSLTQAMGVDLGLDRLTSGRDTRTEVWMMLIEDALNAPILGMGQQRRGGVENSYLLGWVIYGPGMLLLILTMLGSAAFQGLRLLFARGRLGSLERRMADYVLGFYAIYFTGAIFEWYIVARLEASIPMFVIFNCVGAHLLRTAKWQELHGEHLPDAEEYAEMVEEYGRPAA